MYNLFIQILVLPLYLKIYKLTPLYLYHNMIRRDNSLSKFKAKISHPKGTKKRESVDEIKFH